MWWWKWRWIIDYVSDAAAAAASVDVDVVVVNIVRMRTCAPGSSSRAVPRLLLRERGRHGSRGNAYQLLNLDGGAVIVAQVWHAVALLYAQFIELGRRGRLLVGKGPFHYSL